MADDFSERTSITCSFENAALRNRLDQEAKTALYRIAQEAFTNIERHSEASSVSVLLRGSQQGVILRITDNGKGLPSRQEPPASGLGLRNMQERIEQLEGSLTILSSTDTDGGTVIEARLPLSHMLPPPESATQTLKVGE